MAVQPIRAPLPTFQIDLDHSEQFFRVISAVTVDPFKNAVCYFFPFITAFFAHYIEIRENDPTQEAMMPSLSKSLILREIGNLTTAARIRRKIISYTTLNHAFLNCGGSASLTTPALFMPHQHLWRIGKSPFTLERPQDALAADLWKYTDDETRFWIARELGHIKQNDQLLRIAMKIALIASLFILYATPLGALTGMTVFGAAIGLHLVSEKRFEAKMDAVAVDIVARRLNDPRRAVRAALSALDKKRRQNLARRENNFFSRFYITRSGNNVIDFNPFLTSRIERVQKLLQELP